MTDKELLELAAKAAGLYEAWPEPNCDVQWSAEGAGLWCSGEGRGVLWNPLNDDGDALRLATALRLTVSFDTFNDVEYAEVTPPGTHHGYDCAVDNGHDLGSAVRRAIVRTAASIAQSRPMTYAQHATPHQHIKSLLRSADKVLDPADITGTELAQLRKSVAHHAERVASFQREVDALNRTLWRGPPLTRPQPILQPSPQTAIDNDAGVSLLAVAGPRHQRAADAIGSNRQRRVRG